MLSMKSIRNVALSALLTIGAFSAITYTSCNKDECKDVVCKNGGTCAAGVCSCPTGYEGTNCETVSRDKFVGNWSGSDACTSGTYTIALSVAKSTNDINALVNNPGGFGGTVQITGTVTGKNTLSFTNASVGGGRTLTGSMTFNGNAMTFAYTVTPATGSADVCNGTYTKQ
ncbi:MAG: calcium-binding EGF-like domain-containing protein [Chitinophagales bacterium]|nr:calcium-binding EGF-like domain-containing protein [Chitinophagales bacterium]